MKNLILSMCLFAGLTSLVLSAAAQDEAARLLPAKNGLLAELSDNPGSDEFGSRVGLSGNTIVASNQFINFADVYVEPANGWGNMTAPTARLTCSDASFCSQVAIDGDTVVAVGASGPHNQQYAVYLFVKPAGGWTNMTETAKLTDTNSQVTMGQVSISGNTVAVVAETNNPPGAIDLFVKPAAGWKSMTQSARLTAQNQDFFQSVAINGGTVVGGADEYSSGGPGAAYLFVEPAGGWTAMTQTAQLFPSDGVAFGEFGIAVAMAGGEVVVTGFNSNSVSAVYLYEEPTTGWTNMTQTAELTERQFIATGNFGSALAVSGNVVLAGAPGEGARFDKGYVYAFFEPAGGWANMTQSARFTCSTGCSLFGVSIATDGTTAVIGAPSDGVGQALIYGK
jgi:hypothetical protein